jgi:TonB family protein
MFENMLECTKNKQRGKRWLYFAITSVVWTLMLLGSIIGGIFLYDADLDKQLYVITMLNPLPLPPPAPPQLGTGRTSSVSTDRNAHTQMIQPEMTAVHEAPPLPAQLPELPIRAVDNTDIIGDSSSDAGDPYGAVGGDPKGRRDGVFGANGTSETVIPPPPPQPPDQPVPQPKIKQIVQSEGVIRGNALMKPKPDYPTLARSTAIQGDVQIEITISEEGNVINAQVLSGHALLRKAALEAALRWKFNPTMLNKTPVKVQGILTFRFTL